MCNQSQEKKCPDKYIGGEGDRGISFARSHARPNATPTPTRKPTPGSHGRLDKPRPLGDFYRSQPHAMGLLLDTIAPARLTPSPTGLILDAGAGDGRLTKPLIEAGYLVRGVELDDRQHDPALPIDTGLDFLTLTPDDVGPVAVIVTNPPYERALIDRFIRHALHLLPDGGALYALMRHAWMTGIRRRELLPSLTRIVICRRLNMLPADREHDDRGHETNTDYCWFTFTKGCTEGRPLILHAVR
jgi:hypothetical protein